MYRLRVLGGFALEGPMGVAVPPLPQRRAKAVLAMLAVCGDLGCTRERLVALLWPESDEAHSRHSLSDTLRAIRQSLGPDALLSAGDLLRLDPAVGGSDVLAFRTAAEAGRDAEAAEVYGGALLEGFHLDGAPDFERWLDGERTRLAREYAEAIERLATAAAAAGNWGEAAGWWARAEEHDPFNSHLALRHAEALVAIGDRANALKVADEHVRRLRRELDLEPDREVLAAIERLRSIERPAAAQATASRSPGAGAPPPSAAVGRPGGTEPATAPHLLPQPAPAGARPRRWAFWALGAAALAVLAGATLFARRPRPSPAAARPPRTAIAVLPFENLSAGTSHAYLAGGLHEELLTQLGKVSALSVIGRTSVLAYAGTATRLSRIGSDLGVGSIVLGSVQVDRHRMRVNVQLIDPASETQLWAERYDTTLTDVFAVQSDIARRIVAAVGATLTTAEASAIAAPPTRSDEAYQLYLQGLDYFRRPGLRRQNFEIAQHLYERALALDSTFALAHLALSSVHSLMGRLLYDPSPGRRELYRRELGAALRFAPELPQARGAMALEPYWQDHDARAALNRLGPLLRGAHSDGDLWYAVFALYAGLGRWDSSDVAFERASRLGPRNADLFVGRADVLRCRRRFGEAIQAYRRAMLLAPDYTNVHIQLAWSYVMWKGEMDSIRAVLRGPPDGDPGAASPGAAAELAFALLYDRRPDSVLSLLRADPRLFTSPTTYAPRTLVAAWAHRMRGDSAAARSAFDSARVLIDSVAPARPDAWQLHVWRGHALAGLGRREEALAEARWLGEFVRSNRRYNYCPSELVSQAEILAGAGATDSALGAIEQLLIGPSELTAPSLRLDPRFDPIRGEPRFQALLRKYREPAMF